MILGIDEVGRGPWAGPLVVGAVVLDEPIEGLTDSKKLSAKRRVELDGLIRQKAKAHALGWVDAGEIDKLGLAASLRLAAIRAVEQIRAPYHEIIIDGTVNFLQGTGKGRYVTTMKKADLLIASVSAASVIAKVARDNYMAQQDAVYPGYGFASHVGYGTAAHRAAIDARGITPLHRLSFAPLAGYRPAAAAVKETASAATHSTMTGNRAETVVAEELARRGHTILERNWKTRLSEIDVISEYRGTVYFTEVKYRRTAQQGGGIAAVTPEKLRRMRFAAELYARRHRLKQTLRLAVAAVSGSDFRLQAFLEIE